ncbi:MAG: Free methionine-R-sulfoxide reductase [Calditrichaeota bacterium]|nr:Free methionine-R-sulfoxide reductase [Calditrichota bacterium]
MILKQLVDSLLERGERMSFSDWEMEIVTSLRAEIDRFSWVGIYWVRGDELMLGAWDGPAATEHTRIPVGEGICGLAARTRESVVVDDVDAHPEYLACFPDTRSEIVVPILMDGDAVGEIDIDGDEPGAFGERDVQELERLADAISVRVRPE